MATLIACRGIGLIGIGTILIWIAVLMVLGDARSLSKEEYLELKAKLKFLNRPAIKSIHMEYGDIFDCIDIHSQPAFDHPMLKNHSIQMRPNLYPKGIENRAPPNTDETEFIQMRTSSYQKGIENGAPSDPSVAIRLKDGGCPPGTVPILRTRMEDLLRATKLSDFGRKNIIISATDGYDHHYAIISSRQGQFYGTGVDMNVWNPQLLDRRQMSLGQTWIVKGSGSKLNTIEVGWQVNPLLYGDYLTHLFVYWTADGYNKTGCYNHKCEGFVQVSSVLTPGMVLQPVSTIDGTQKDISILVFQDLSTGNWWLRLGEEYVGYWPKAIFTSLAGTSGDYVQWGGEIATHDNLGLTRPPMGSGRFPTEGFGKASFMKQIQVVDGQNNLIDAPNDVYPYANVPLCYDVDGVHRDGGDSWNPYFFFGGPGGC